eukprot:1158991-Pelagomonas_calceolata.AAC.3
MPLLGPGSGGCPFQGLRSPHADHSSLPLNEQALHNSNCDGIFSLCYINGVSSSMNREVKAWKFADAMRSMTCPQP